MDWKKCFGGRAAPKGEEITMATIHIVAHVDVGFGNYLEVYGNWPGGGPWTNAFQMKCTGPKSWEAVISCDTPIEFKILRNRKDWEMSNNHNANPNSVCTVSPEFPPIAHRPEPSPVRVEREDESSKTDGMGLLEVGLVVLVADELLRDD